VCAYQPREKLGCDYIDPREGTILHRIVPERYDRGEAEAEAGRGGPKAIDIVLPSRALEVRAALYDRHRSAVPR
jgi:hypothetical protein